jgi:hypothetical protein
MAWITTSSMRASSDARLPVLELKEPMQKARVMRVQLALEGTPYHKPKHTVGTDTIGIDLGPSTIAIVPRVGQAALETLGAELAPDARAIRRLQRQMDRQRRAANPEHYERYGAHQATGQTTAAVEAEPQLRAHPPA